MIEKLKNKFNALLWDQDLKHANTVQLFLINALRISYGTARDLSGGLPSLRAMGLVYTTLLSIVPLLAVSFSVLKGFGAHNQLEPALISILEPLGEKGLQVSQQIISFVDNMKVGVLGSIGLLFLILTVLSLVKKIESAFNHTWRIQVTRNLFQRFSNYLSVILIGPLFLFTAAGLTASFHSAAIVDKFLSIEPFGTILLLLGELVPYLLTIITFTLIYILIPNTKVKFKSALYGAVIATILWKAAGSLFTSFIVDSTNYTAIYSGFAILVIFMIWIHINWLIVLTGASISYYHQNPDCIHDKSQVVRLSCQLREKLALTIMQLVANNFHHNEGNWTIKTLAKKTNISETAITMIISALQSKNLITTTGKNNQQYLLSQASESISIDMILEAARTAEESPNLRPDDVDAADQVNEVILSIESAISESSKNTTLKDLI
ncbi:MAG: ribonuclease BN [Gammaproteobacteria bacterium]|nr:MAG: ribonuclease BN [Gammaproteobacteria bacterium]